MRIRFEPLRGPSGAVADLLRLVCLASVVVAALSQPVEGTIRFAVIFLVLPFARSRVPGPLDAAFAAATLVSAWASALGWYMTYPWVDIPIHFVTTGAAASVAYFLLVEVGIVPQRRREVLWNLFIITMIGGTLCVVWEIYEWTASRFIPNEMVVSYSDTIGDQTMGTLGATMAGFLVARWLCAHELADSHDAVRRGS